MKTELGRIVTTNRLLVPAYVLGLAGVLLQIVGGTWDVAWHVLGLVETFFTLPHLILYTGAALLLVAGITGLIIRQHAAELDRYLLAGLLIAAAAGGLQIFAGGFDFWWHDKFGFDPFLFTPSHSVLITGIALGGVGMAMGLVRILLTHHNGVSFGGRLLSPKLLQLLVLVALAVLWRDLNTLIYLLTDTRGIAYTFGLGRDFIAQNSQAAFLAGVITLAATGTLVFLAVKSLIGWRGSVTTVAVISAAVSVSVNLGFRASVLAGRPQGSAIASFIPAYVMFLIPVVLFDLLLTDTERKWRVILAAALIAPFSSYLDGWYSLVLWVQLTQLVPVLLLPLAAAGIVAYLARTGFAAVVLTGHFSPRSGVQSWRREELQLK